MADGRLNQQERYRIHVLRQAGFRFGRSPTAWTAHRAPSAASSVAMPTLDVTTRSAPSASVASDASARTDVLASTRCASAGSSDYSGTNGAPTRLLARRRWPATSGSIATSTPTSSAEAPCSIACAASVRSVASAAFAMAAASSRTASASMNGPPSSKRASARAIGRSTPCTHRAARRSWSP